MLITARRLAALLVLLSAPIAGCAYADDGPYPNSEILSELPANAPPGECYARVAVPGEPVAPPPLVQSAQWVLNPGPPGSPGPIWCLEPVTSVAVAPPPAIERYGWIRVLCDTDATPARIGEIQHRLHDRGVYAGPYSGRYDRATAEAVARFQSQARIAHGGYLSLTTIDALDAAGPAYAPPPAPYPQLPPQAVYGGAYAYPPAVTPQAGPCGCETMISPPVVYQQPYYPCCAAPAPAYPCCAAATTYSSYGYGATYGGGYGFGAPVPAYAGASASAYAGAGGYASARASASASVQNGWLVWNGKSGF